MKAVNAGAADPASSAIACISVRNSSAHDSMVAVNPALATQHDDLEISRCKCGCGLEADVEN
jgi:hypothetical protein